MWQMRAPRPERDRQGDVCDRSAADYRQLALDFAGHAADRQGADGDGCGKCGRRDPSATGRVTFAIGPLLIIANWPWTLLGMLPTDKALMATDVANAGAETRALLLQWN